MRSLPRRTLLFGLAGLIAVMAGTATARGDLMRVAIVHADVSSSADFVQSQLLGSGLFGTVDLFDASDPGGTPTLADLSSYDAVLAYTNFAPDDAAALGDVLADFADLGRGVVLATYGLGDVTSVGGTAFAGRIATSGYSPLVISGDLGDLDGGINALVPGDPIFAGVDLSTPDFYYHDAFFAHPTLDAGATLLATDTGGIDLIARSANGRILAMNLFPGVGGTDNSDAFYTLLANSVHDVGSRRMNPVPEPSALVLGGLGGLVVLAGARRRRSQPVGRDSGSV